VPPSTRKFSVGFQGGFDGSDPATPQNLGEDITSSNTQGFDVSGPDAPGTEAYQKAIGILGNEDQFDINLLVTPGIINDQHGAVVRSGINMVEERADAFYVFDPTGVESTIQDAISSVQTIDSSYAATYYPWMRIRDQQRNKQVRVPPSVLIPRVYAFNDQTAAEWFAPAGFERGGVPEAISAVLRLQRDDRDELYANRVNPIAQFPDQGVSVWGQKTLQTQASALDRVNVRRLLIRVKKFIASTSRFLVFEQNVPETRNRFLNIVNPFLNQVQQQNGLFAFRVKMDAENNPPEVIDRNQLVGEIFLQPTRTAEFIRLTFNVLPTGAEFEDL
jgi:phage tail sheath protein FI